MLVSLRKVSAGEFVDSAVNESDEQKERNNNDGAFTSEKNWRNWD